MKTRTPILSQVKSLHTCLVTRSTWPARRLFWKPSLLREEISVVAFSVVLLFLPLLVWDCGWLWPFPIFLINSGLTLHFGWSCWLPNSFVNWAATALSTSKPVRYSNLKRCQPNRVFTSQPATQKNPQALRISPSESPSKWQNGVQPDHSNRRCRNGIW